MGGSTDRRHAPRVESPDSVDHIDRRTRLASPPYDAQNGASAGGLDAPRGLPPQYASRTDLGAKSTHSVSSHVGRSDSDSSNEQAAAHRLEQYGDLPLEKKLRDRAAEADAAAQPLAASTSAGPPSLPRIAIADPLQDMRSRGLSKPEFGLSEKSDWPANDGQTPRAVRPNFSRHNSEASVNTQSDFGYDDFDWSDDEGVEETLRTERKEETAARKVRNKRLSPWSIGRWMFTSFLGNLLLSALLVVPAIVLQFLYRNEATDANRVRRDYVTDNVQAWLIWASFNLFMSWVFHIFVEIFPRLCLGVVALVWGRTNQATLNAVEYYNAQKGYIKPLFYAACSWASFAIIMNSIYHLYNHSDPKHGSRAAYLYRIYQVVQFFFFVTLTICAEKIFIKNVALSFHKSAFAERIAEVARALEVFDRLKDYRPKHKEQQQNRYFGFRQGRGTPGNTSNAHTPLETASPYEEGQQQQHRDFSGGSGSVSPKRGFLGKAKHSNKRAQNTDPTMTPQSGQESPSAARYPPRAGAAHPRQALKKVNAARENALNSLKLTASSASKLARVAMKDPLAALQSEQAGGIADINSPAEAKKLAKTIFNAFRGRHHRSYLVLSDFEPAFSSQSQAKEAFAVFDKDGNGDISQTEIKNCVLTVYKERRHLMKAIGDTNHAVAQLDLIVFIVACVIIMFEAFGIFDVNVSKTLTTFYTLGIAFAFIFKESAQNVFDSIVFIFVTHPMDTGDRIQLGDAVMVVKKMSLLSSEFTLADGTDMYVANAVLANMMIINFRRSGYQWENFLIQVDINTSLEQLDAVERDMCHWLQTEPERHFEPSTAMVPQRIVMMRYIEISIGMTHRANWNDWGARFVRKNAFGAALTYYLKQHNVRFYQPTQPVFWQGGQGDGQSDAGAGFSEDFEEPPTYTLDDFEPRQEGLTAAAATGTTRRPNYMGFTPAADETDNALRQRKTRMKGVTTQGGDN
ncbi:unnamed protein product [Parajaminaea phylloscopi]